LWLKSNEVSVLPTEEGTVGRRYKAIGVRHKVLKVFRVRADSSYLGKTAHETSVPSVVKNNPFSVFPTKEGAAHIRTDSSSVGKTTLYTP
jgi:hypothetical protein